MGVVTLGLGNVGSVVAGGLSTPATLATVSPNDLKQGFCSQLGYVFETLATDYLERGNVFTKDSFASFILLPYELQALDFRGTVTRQKIITSMIDQRLKTTADTLTGNIALKGNMEAIIFALMSILGEPTVTISGPKFTHTFKTTETTAKTFSLMNITPVGFDIFRGMYGTSISLIGKAGGGFQVGVTVSGRSMTHDPGPAVPNITDRATKWDTLFFNDTTVTLKDFPETGTSGKTLSVSNLAINFRARYARNKTLRSAPVSDLPVKTQIIVSGSFTVARHDMTSDFLFNFVKKNFNQRGTLHINHVFDANNGFLFDIPVLLRVTSGVPSAKIVPIRVNFETEVLPTGNDGFLIKADYTEDLT